jgi:hypothetical protein
LPTKARPIKIMNNSTTRKIAYSGKDNVAEK